MFRVTRDDPSVIEFSFDQKLFSAKNGDFVDVIVRIVSPVMSGTLMLAGCELYVTNPESGEAAPIPPYWDGDRAELLKTIVEIIEVNDVPEIKKEEEAVDPAFEKAKQELDLLACEVARVMIGAWGRASLTDMLDLQQNFHSKVLKELNHLNQLQECHPQTPQPS